jgi:predicted  nucleic acid-binding Zn-ribbon protein
MKLRPQMLVEVKKGAEIITCDSCSRILYAPAAETRAATPES